MRGILGGAVPLVLKSGWSLSNARARGGAERHHRIIASHILSGFVGCQIGIIAINHKDRE